MPDYYLVELVNGPTWDDSLRRREQAQWAEHAAFMDTLAADGFVVLAGPVGAGDGDSVLLVVDADSDDAVRTRLADDPWIEGVLRIETIRPWSIWVRTIS